MLRLDLIFSNWIFVWFILFSIGIVTYNPIFILLTAFSFVILESAYIWYHGANCYNITKFIVINILLKNIPLLLLWSQNKMRIKFKDIYFTIILFAIYNIYLYMNDTHIYAYYTKLLVPYYKNIDEPNQKTLISNTYDKIYKYLIHLSL